MSSSQPASRRRPRRPDEVVVSFRSACVYGEDAALLRPGRWLNDALVVWWSEALTARMELDAAQTAASSSTSSAAAPPPPPPLPCLLVQPATVMLATHILEPDEVPEALAGLSLPSFPLVLFPINNSDSPLLPASGSHWSLLAYVRPLGRFFHFDSSQGMNLAAARRAARAMRPVLTGGGGGGSAAAASSSSSSLTSSSSSSSSSTAAVEEVASTPQQANGYDCGVHMLMTMDYLCRAAAASSSSSSAATAPSFDGLASFATPDRASANREMLEEKLEEMAEG
jgi:hypothetical protein